MCLTDSIIVTNLFSEKYNELKMHELNNPILRYSEMMYM